MTVIEAPPYNRWHKVTEREAALWLIRRYVVNDEGCWEWQGAINNVGYGTVSEHTHSFGRLVHRVSYQVHVGPIPAGKILDHTCHSKDLTCTEGPDCLHRRCLNPTHLEPVTHLVNVRRAEPYMKELCVGGHPRTPENTRIKADGHRDCKVCHRERECARKRRVRAAARA